MRALLAGAETMPQQRYSKHNKPLPQRGGAYALVRFNEGVGDPDAD